MSWRGDGYPVLIVDGTSYSYPYPIRDGREESIEAESSRIVTRLNGERVHLDRKFRHRFAFEWGTLTETQIEQLVTWYHALPRTVVTVRPHHDVTVYQEPCWIDELDITPGVSGVTAYRARIVLSGVNWFTGTPIPDESSSASTDIIAHL